jgi:hypothetical protein
MEYRWFRFKIEKRVDIAEAVQRGRKVPALRAGGFETMPHHAETWYKV